MWDFFTKFVIAFFFFVYTESVALNICIQLVLHVCNYEFLPFQHVSLVFHDFFVYCQGITAYISLFYFFKGKISTFPLLSYLMIFRSWFLLFTAFNAILSVASSSPEAFVVVELLGLLIYFKRNQFVNVL